MAGDPFRIFAEESESRRETIKLVWPELYQALARPAGAKPTWGCALSDHGDPPGGRRSYHPVAGRIWLNGPPACGPCLNRLSDRPDGYPLDRIDPREWNR